MKSFTIQWLVLFILAFTVMGCGSDSSSSETTSEALDEETSTSQPAPTETDTSTESETTRPTRQPTVRMSGAVVDGYVAGATVCIDLNLNGHCDDWEPRAEAITNEEDEKIFYEVIDNELTTVKASSATQHVQTDDQGRYIFSFDPEDPEAQEWISHENFGVAPILIQGGFDLDTLQNFNNTLTAPFPNNFLEQFVPQEVDDPEDDEQRPQVDFEDENITAVTSILDRLLIYLPNKTRATLEADLRLVLGRLDAELALNTDPITRLNDDNDIELLALNVAFNRAIQAINEILGTADEREAQEQSNNIYRALAVAIDLTTPSNRQRANFDPGANPSENLLRALAASPEAITILLGANGNDLQDPELQQRLERRIRNAARAAAITAGRSQEVYRGSDESEDRLTQAARRSTNVIRMVEAASRNQLDQEQINEDEVNTAATEARDAREDTNDLLISYLQRRLQAEALSEHLEEFNWQTINDNYSQYSQALNLRQVYHFIDTEDSTSALLDAIKTTWAFDIERFILQQGFRNRAPGEPEQFDFSDLEVTLQNFPATLTLSSLLNSYYNQLDVQLRRAVGNSLSITNTLRHYNIQPAQTERQLLRSLNFIYSLENEYFSVSDAIELQEPSIEFLEEIKTQLQTAGRLSRIQNEIHRILQVERVIQVLEEEGFWLTDADRDRVRTLMPRSEVERLAEISFSDHLDEGKRLYQYLPSLLRTGISRSNRAIKLILEIDAGPFEFNAELPGIPENKVLALRSLRRAYFLPAEFSLAQLVQAADEELTSTRRAGSESASTTALLYLRSEIKRYLNNTTLLQRVVDKGFTLTEETKKEVINLGNEIAPSFDEDYNLYNLSGLPGELDALLDLDQQITSTLTNYGIELTDEESRLYRAQLSYYQHPSEFDLVGINSWFKSLGIRDLRDLTRRIDGIIQEFQQGFEQDYPRNFTVLTQDNAHLFYTQAIKANVTDSLIFPLVEIIDELLIHGVIYDDLDFSCNLDGSYTLQQTQGGSFDPETRSEGSFIIRFDQCRSEESSVGFSFIDGDVEVDLIYYGVNADASEPTYQFTINTLGPVEQEYLADVAADNVERMFIDLRNLELTYYDQPIGPTESYREVLNADAIMVRRGTETNFHIIDLNFDLLEFYQLEPRIERDYNSFSYDFYTQIEGQDYLVNLATLESDLVDQGYHSFRNIFFSDYEENLSQGILRVTGHNNTFLHISLLEGQAKLHLETPDANCYAGPLATEATNPELSFICDNQLLEAFEEKLELSNAERQTLETAIAEIGIFGVQLDETNSLLDWLASAELTNLYEQLAITLDPVEPWMATLPAPLSPLSALDEDTTPQIAELVSSANPLKQVAGPLVDATLALLEYNGLDAGDFLSEPSCSNVQFMHQGEDNGVTFNRFRLSFDDCGFGIENSGNISGNLYVDEAIAGLPENEEIAFRFYTANGPIRVNDLYLELWRMEYTLIVHPLEENPESPPYLEEYSAPYFTTESASDPDDRMEFSNYRSISSAYGFDAMPASTIEFGTLEYRVRMDDGVTFEVKLHPGYSEQLITPANSFVIEEGELLITGSMSTQIEIFFEGGSGFGFLIAGENDETVFTFAAGDPSSTFEWSSGSEDSPHYSVDYGNKTNFNLFTELDTDIVAEAIRLAVIADPVEEHFGPLLQALVRVVYQENNLFGESFSCTDGSYGINDSASPALISFSNCYFQDWDDETFTHYLDGDIELDFETEGLDAPYNLIAINNINTRNPINGDFITMGYHQGLPEDDAIYYQVKARNFSRETGLIEQEAFNDGLLKDEQVLALKYSAELLARRDTSVTPPYYLDLIDLIWEGRGYQYDNPGPDLPSSEILDLKYQYTLAQDTGFEEELVFAEFDTLVGSHQLYDGFDVQASSESQQDSVATLGSIEVRGLGFSYIRLEMLGFFEDELVDTWINIENDEGDFWEGYIAIDQGYLINGLDELESDTEIDCDPFSEPEC